MSYSTRRSPRGVTLIEGLVSTLILLTGMVGVLQGLGVASMQNSMANRHTRATIIAQQLATVIEQQGKERLVAGLFASGQCAAAVPAGVADFTGDLTPIYGVAGVPPSLGAQGYTTASACFIDFDSLGAAYTALTPGYTTQDNTTFQRLVAVYRHPSNPEMTYIGINVGWRDAGRVRVVKRFTAVYDIGRNQTNLDF